QSKDGGLGAGIGSIISNPFFVVGFNFNRPAFSGFYENRRKVVSVIKSSSIEVSNTRCYFFRFYNIRNRAVNRRFAGSKSYRGSRKTHYLQEITACGAALFSAVAVKELVDRERVGELIFLTRL